MDISRGLNAARAGYEHGMSGSPDDAQDPRRTQESDHLPEVQPATGGGTTDPGERQSRVGLDPRPDPDSRPNTGNPHDHDR